MKILVRPIRFLPSHPHEGDVSAPPNQGARVIAEGTSKATGEPTALLDTQRYVLNIALWLAGAAS